MYKFLIKWQIIFFFFSVFSGLNVFAYLCLREDVGRHKAIPLSGVIMAVVLGLVIILRIIISLISKFHGEVSISKNDRSIIEKKGVSFLIFFLKFLGVNAIAFGYTLGICGLFVFMVNK